MKRYLNPEDVKITYPFAAFIGDIFRFIKPYRWRFFVASVIRFVGDIANLYPAYGLATMVSFLAGYSRGQSLSLLWIVFGLWMLSIIIRQLSQFFAKYLGYTVAERAMLDTTYRGVSHLFRLDMAWHERENSGNKLKRIQNGSQGLGKVLQVWIDILIEVAVNFVGTILIISRFDGTIAWAMVAFLISYFSFSFFMTRRAARAAYLVGVEEEKVHGLLFEAIGNIRSVKAMTMAQSLKRFISQAMDDLFARIKTRIFRFRIRASTLSAWSWTFKLGILAFIAIGILKGRYELGLLILFNSYFSDIRGSVSELSDASQDVTVARYSIARMNETLAEPVNIDSEGGKQVFPRDWKVISVKNISFSYGKNVVLSDVSFDIRRGERIGIVGLSGAGKSTLFKLLLKEYESGKGDVLVDGVSLRNISKSDYFKYVSVVLQETEVFNFSLRENITLVNPDRAGDTSLLSRVLKIAHVSDFVRKLPKGIDTLIGERGVKLSGGEKQRLGIARAVFKQPQLLLLDEATSHLDLESEEKIRESLHEFFEKVTAVVIAHRLTTIKEMDKIILLEGGRVVEKGNFGELYKKRGRFYELWEMQKL